VDAIFQDLRYGLRLLIKRPVFTTVAIVAMALGIGANSAIFTAVNAVLLRPLPFGAADRLVWCWGTQPQLSEAPIAPANFLDIRDQSQMLDGLVAFRGQSFNIAGQNEPERVRGAAVSADFFDVLGVNPAYGRAFSSDEDQAGKNQIVIISYGLWQRRFGSNPLAVGQSMTLNDRPLTIVGVSPAGFQTPGSSEVWTPLAFDSKEKTVRDTHSLGVIGRLKGGVTLQQAQSEIDGITKRLEDTFPTTNRGIGVRLVDLQEQVVGKYKLTLLVVWAAVGFVLLIACANVANLLLARAATRQKEIAIRTALGATRGRVARQLLTESVLLAVLGGGLGLLLAIIGTEMFVASNPTYIPRIREISVDGRVVAVTFLVSLVTGLLFGVVPALVGSRPDLNEALKEGGRTGSSGLRGRRVQSLLVVFEIALALVPLVGAGLMIKSFLRLQQVDLGFDGEGVLTMQIALPRSKYPTAAQRAGFFQGVVERLRPLAGVEAVGAITNLPLSGAADSTSFVIEGRQPAGSGEAPLTEYRSITPDYFAAMGISFLKGNKFSEADRADSRGVVIINDTLARRFFPDEDPLGKRLGLSGPPDWREIVGVVRDVRHFGPGAEAKPECYIPFGQNAAGYLQYASMTVVARAAGDPSGLINAARREVLAVDNSQPVFNVKTMEQVLSDSISQRRLDTLLLGLLAGFALLLAAIGTYSVVAYSVSQRTHEIGVRMALGARAGDVIGLVVWQGLLLVVLGAVIGVGGALALTRFVSKLLYQVSVLDPFVFIIVVAVLCGTAVVASYVPARRAAKVDPMIALRSE